MANQYPKRIDIHYTVRSIEVYKNFAGEIAEKLRLINDKKNVEVTFNWYVTEKTANENDDENVELFDEITLLKGMYPYPRLNFQ